jgi:hypothetical protein
VERGAAGNLPRFWTGIRDSNPYALRRRNLKTGENEASPTIPQDSAASEDDKARDDAGSEGPLPRSAAASEPSDAEFERGILDALAKGLDGVAKSLAGRLDERRRARAGNVVDLNERIRRR